MTFLHFLFLKERNWAHSMCLLVLLPFYVDQCDQQNAGLQNTCFHTIFKSEDTNSPTQEKNNIFLGKIASHTFVSLLGLFMLMYCKLYWPLLMWACHTFCAMQIDILFRSLMYPVFMQHNKILCWFIFATCRSWAGKFVFASCSFK